MVQLTRIYTKGGDKGTTSLGTGKRVPKHDQRVSAYGTVDEANAAIGIVRLHTRGEADEVLARIQNDLFDLGADLAAPETGETLSYEPLRVIEAQVTRIEGEIDHLNANLDPLRSFILPGGSPAAAHLHLARTVARRAERIMVELSRFEGETIDEPALKYINRLSDFLFVAARFANDGGKADILWVPGKNR